MKTKNHHTHTLAYSLMSALLVVAVVLSATHAKDIVNPQPLRNKSQRVAETSMPRPTAIDEPIQKSLGDLHNHTDKTMLKHFVKASPSDAPSLAAKRQEREDHLSAEEQPVSLRLFQAYFMMQIAYAYVRG